MDQKVESNSEKLNSYLDTCVWCRLFDKPSKRIIEEANAVIQILAKSDKGVIEIIGSTAVLAEIDLIHDENKRQSVKDLVEKSCKAIVWIDEEDIKLAEEIMKSCNVDSVDAIHIAVASKNADVFITVDDKILKKRNCLKKYIDVKNPLDIV
jgi:predicted nucleic acid-binding protein